MLEKLRGVYEGHENIKNRSVHTEFELKRVCDERGLQLIKMKMKNDYAIIHIGKKTVIIDNSICELHIKLLLEKINEI